MGNPLAELSLALWLLAGSVPDHKLTFVPCENESGAHFICACLNSSPAPSRRVLVCRANADLNSRAGVCASAKV